jgi:phosphate transport system permease protein
MNNTINKTSKDNEILSRLQVFLHYGDRPWYFLIISMAILVVVLMLAIAVLLWNDSLIARHEFGLNFIFPTLDASWNPVKETFDAWPFIYGTLVTSFLSLFLAIPVSIGVAIFLAELSPEWLRQPISWMVELLAAIPSVVYGLWGIFVLLPTIVVPIGMFLGEILGKVPGLQYFFQAPIPASGSSRLAAALILSIMVIPTITAVSRDVFLAIPDSQREASLALGATQWETIWKTLIPYGLSGILGAVILGLGRALGETMAVTMVIGNSIEGTLSVLRPGYTMASIIANEFAEAVSATHTSALIYTAFVLFVMTLILNLVARFLVWGVARRTPMEARA